jgi:hypothetical protein
VFVTASVYDYDLAVDYGACFDVADRLIKEYEKYSDLIKKKWIIKLIKDKEQLQRQVVELQATIEKLQAR